MRHVDLHVQLDRLTSLAKVLCHSPLWKQMLIEARERKWWIQDGSPPMGACWVILWKLPLILDGYGLNDIWTIVKNDVCNL